MRSTSPVRTRGRGRLVAGRLAIGIPASAVALTAAQALGAQAQTGSPVPLKLKARQIAFNHRVVAKGGAPADAHHTLQLQFKAAGNSKWQAIGSTTAAADGRYTLAALLRRSGAIRVVDVSVSAASNATSATPTPLTARIASNMAARVSVTAALRVKPQTLNVRGGQPVAISGRFLPGLQGRVVYLDELTGHGWRTIAATKTGAAGRFTLRFSAQGSQQLRVGFKGDLQNGATASGAGSLAAYTPAGASWYYDGGTTGCGFHAYYGVANRTLPCGTRVKMSYRGRTVTAVVDDRGPYVGGRDWDLNQNTAAALGFGGVDTVWVAF